MASSHDGLLSEMPYFPHFRTLPMIGVLIFPDFQLLDAAGPISVFEIAARFAGGGPAIPAMAIGPGAVRRVAGGEGTRAAAACEKTLSFVRSVARRGVRVASVCSGAYILAEAGLLDGK